MANKQVTPEISINNQVCGRDILSVMKCPPHSGVSGCEALRVDLCYRLVLPPDNKIHRDSLQLWRHPELLQQILIFRLMKFCSRECYTFDNQPLPEGDTTVRTDAIILAHRLTPAPCFIARRKHQIPPPGNAGYSPFLRSGRKTGKIADNLPAGAQYYANLRSKNVRSTYLSSSASQ